MLFMSGLVLVDRDVEIWAVKLLIDFGGGHLSPDMHSGLFDLENFDNIQDVNLDAFDVIGIDETGHFLNQLHQNLDNMLTEKWQIDSKDRVVLFEFDFL